MANDIRMKNPIEDGDESDPAQAHKPDLGDEKLADEVTSANEDLQRAHGEDPTPEAAESPLDDATGSHHSVDEHASAGTESAEDKVMDVLNSGVLRI